MKLSPLPIEDRGTRTLNGLLPLLLLLSLPGQAQSIRILTPDAHVVGWAYAYGLDGVCPDWTLIDSIDEFSLPLPFNGTAVGSACHVAGFSYTLCGGGSFSTSPSAEASASILLSSDELRITLDASASTHAIGEYAYEYFWTDVGAGIAGADRFSGFVFEALGPVCIQGGGSYDCDSTHPPFALGTPDRQGLTFPCNGSISGCFPAGIYLYVPDIVVHGDGVASATLRDQMVGWLAARLTTNH